MNVLGADVAPAFSLLDHGTDRWRHRPQAASLIVYQADIPGVV